MTNLVKTMEELKERGLWFVCADMDGEQMYDLNLTGPIGLVVGSEGEGVGRLVKENCDFVARGPHARTDQFAEGFRGRRRAR